MFGAITATMQHMSIYCHTHGHEYDICICRATTACVAAVTAPYLTLECSGSWHRQIEINTVTKSNTKSGCLTLTDFTCAS